MAEISESINPERARAFNLNTAVGLSEMARKLVTPGKGIVALDESVGKVGVLGTIEKRLISVGVPEARVSDPELRGSYRAMLCGTPGAGRFISGAILEEQTIDQSVDSVRIRDLLKAEGIQVGIKVDKGVRAYKENSPEKVLKESFLSDLGERLQRFATLDAVFAKCRAVIVIRDPDCPSADCVEENAKILAKYAAICQRAGIVPIVEPEVLRDGEYATHAAQKCFEVTRFVLQRVFAHLQREGVDCSAMLLKPNMVVAGKACSEQPTPEKVAALTLRCLELTVPRIVPGIVFLSGGLTPEEATANLRAINSERCQTMHPWKLTFSFGRALQDGALKGWWNKGEGLDFAKGRAWYLEHARANSEVLSTF